jgi:MoaA/NifB/PqqE/SkfB family radical SAM enzyme
LLDIHSMRSGSATDGVAPRVLGILLTSKCNIACRHCCNNSHPTAERTARANDLEQLIDAASDIPSITDVGFSGGEPLLKRDILLAAVRRAAQRGYAISVTTNGFWGNSAGAARMLDSLREAGLTTLWISTSAFHLEFIGLEIVARAVSAGLAAGLEVNVNVVESAGFTREHVRAALGSDISRVWINVMPCLPAGRALDEVALAEYGPDEARPLGNCRHHFAKLAVDLDGTVWPCCSPGGFTEPLRLGSTRETPLAEIVARARMNPLITILEEVGPAFFLPFLRDSDVADDLPERFTDQCHLCHAMLSSRRAAAVVAAACDQLATDLARTTPSDRPITRLAAVASAE